MLPQAELDLLRRVSDRGQPPVPDWSIRRSLELAASDETTHEVLVAQLESDAHLALGLLAFANLPLRSLPATTRTIPQTIQQMGRRKCCEVLWCLALSDVIQQSVSRMPPRAADRLWRHSLLTGVLTQSLSAAIPKFLPPDPMAAGMAHDLGHILLSSPAPRLGIVWHTEHDELPEHSSAPPPELDHCRLGSSLLEFWSAPPSLIAAARFHHAPDRAPVELIPLVAGVRLADIVAESLDTESSKRPVYLTTLPTWAEPASLPPWNGTTDLDRLLIELLPQAIVDAERLANLLVMPQS